VTAKYSEVHFTGFWANSDHHNCAMEGGVIPPIMDPTVKGLAPSSQNYDGSPLRIAIVHTRWNQTIIEPLVTGTVAKLREQGVKESNIVVQSVPGSFELPYACSKVLAASRVQASSNMQDLLGGLNFSSPRSGTPAPSGASATGPVTVDMPNEPFDAVIAIGCLIKGSTMHFEYICDAVSHALMKLQMDTGTPVIFGVLTCLTEDQALERAGVGKGANKGHNHGEDWGLAAVEMASHTRRWAEGRFK
jgi:6,7-dimethyl-8-ribityllumazine synthase